MLTNAERKLYKSLSVKKHRDAQRLFLVEGRRSVLEALNSDFTVRRILGTAAFLDSAADHAIGAAIMKHRAKLETVSQRDLDAIADTVHAQGIAAIVEMKRTSLDVIVTRERPEALIVAIDAITDPGNLGTIVRTCDWFGVDGILLGEGCVDLYNPKVVRATMGSIFHVPIAEGIDLVKAVPALRDAGYAILATDTAGPGGSVRRSGRRMILFGNEARGISEEVQRLADETFAIPRFGRAESLNVSVACGVVLGEARRAQQAR